MPTPADAAARFIVDDGLLTRAVHDGLLVARPTGTAIDVIPEVTHLDEAGRVVLEACADPVTAADIAERIAIRHGGAAGDYVADVGRAISMLADLGVVRRVP